MSIINYDSEEDEINERLGRRKKLDISWINEFEKTDKEYEIFYKENLMYVKVTIIYVNKYNEIDKIKEEKIIMRNPNVISKESIIEILKRNSINDNKKYTITTLLKYNIDLDPSDIRSFLLNRDHNYNGDEDDEDYLSVIKHIDDIIWNKTISMFQDLNNLFIIFYENTKIMENKNGSNNNGSTQRTTKKIYFGSLSSHKKTLKKPLKENSHY
jgi:hypothetical protein